MALQISVGYAPKTKPGLAGQDIIRLLSGIPDRVVLSEVETSDKAFDVSPASALNLKQALVSKW
jgi:hypothetical protein